MEFTFIQRNMNNPQINCKWFGPYDVAHYHSETPTLFAFMTFNECVPIAQWAFEMHDLRIWPLSFPDLSQVPPIVGSPEHILDCLRFTLEDVHASPPLVLDFASVNGLMDLI
ncbi:hypothetical protein TNCV_5040841 [Trichonephila clavipes]|nr:hypothetical protein TNCV_5040841 [Trichonephila clavipes]